MPVWHITLLARPVTWGYFLFGAQRGLAWSWWFQTFSCFTVLWLLLEVVLRGRTILAACGALWFCASAYVVCYSLWPAYAAFFPCLGCLALYHVLNSSKPKVQLLCGVLAGLSFPGLLMFLYPPWQVVLGYLFLALFIGLFIRDRLYEKVRALAPSQALALTVALVLATSLSAAFLVTCWPALQAMRHTVYPGGRIYQGGDYSLGMLFKGIYNLRTIYELPEFFGNPCMAASFYYFFPAVMTAVCLSRWWARRLGAVGWALLLYIGGWLLYALVGLPAWLAKLSLLSFTNGLQGDLGLGLAAVILCVYTLAQAPAAEAKAGGWPRRAIPVLAGAGTVALYLVYGLMTQANAKNFPPISFAIFAALLAGYCAYAMLAGQWKGFCALVLMAVLTTAAFFNPLTTRLDFLYTNDLAQQIKRLNEKTPGGPPLWACYGMNYSGILVGMLGGRTLTWVQFYPQLELWRVLDPSRQQEFAYNRYAHVFLKYGGEAAPVKFIPTIDSFQVEVSPNHPGLRSLGVRYILAQGESQKSLAEARLQLLYKSPSDEFSIFEYPTQVEQPQAAANARSVN
ncbi:MAG: hypothetical protein HYR56_06235 [Acidobacteria bacterium]|nr:hypothetical protein [Acidobacteriota bacterium]MBI3427412.1 hypothetical protein [Acidobacteriota bacterium]